MILYSSISVIALFGSEEVLGLCFAKIPGSLRVYLALIVPEIIKSKDDRLDVFYYSEVVGDSMIE